MTFALGEIVIAVRPSDEPSDSYLMAGEEVTIIGALELRMMDDHELCLAYLVAHAAHPRLDFRAKPHWLRKRPTTDARASWESCAFVPANARCTP